MPFCRFTSEFLIDHYTLVDNLFVNEYLPYAPENAVRVYIYGLYLCSNPTSCDNTLESMAGVLNMSVDAVVEAFRYFEENGLVQLTNRTPLEVKYFPVKTSLAPPKKYKPEKYSDFNTQMQKLFPTRMITPNEYNEYYGVIESQHIQTEAMLLIIQYCVNLKGVDVRYPYIITVAKDWALTGVKTYSDVEEKLRDHEATLGTIKLILRELGVKTSGTFEDREYYLKWTKNWGFEQNAIMYAAKLCKNKGGMKKLDKLLDEYYRMNIYASREMEEYTKHKEQLYSLARSVNKIIGLYYESLDHLVENYISNWVQKGYDEQAITTIADYCFKRSIRTWEGMNAAVAKFYKLGLLSTGSIEQYLTRLLENDAVIAEILSTAGSKRNVNSGDRDYYKTWSAVWGFSDEMILYAAALAADKAQPFPYLNQVLSRLRENNAFTLEAAKAVSAAPPPKSNNNKNDYIKRDYTREELNAFFDDLENFDNIEV